MATPHCRYFIVNQVNISGICLATPVAPVTLCHTALESEAGLPGPEVTAQAPTFHAGVNLRKIVSKPDFEWNVDPLAASDFHRQRC
jgi:hypothetical protein